MTDRKNNIWNYPEDFLRLKENQIHLWLINMNNKLDYNHLLSVMPEIEINKSKKFLFMSDRNRYIISHGLLRIIISKYIDSLPKDISFFNSINGKPYILKPVEGIITFNVSHSGELVLIAIAKNIELGVDIELIQTSNNTNDVIECFFSEKEIDEYSKLPENIKNRAFYTCWTRKESFIKAYGVGLNFPLKDLSVSPDPEKNPEIIISNDKYNKYYIKDIYFEDINYTGAITYTKECHDFQYWKWN